MNPRLLFQRLETPGTFVIMGIYLGLFLAAWALAFVYLAVRWGIG